MTRRYLHAIYTIVLTMMMGACSTIQEAPPRSEPTRNPLPNTDSAPTTTFRATSTTPQSCNPPPGGPFGDIAYSGIIKTGNSQWLYLRDTKTCLAREWSLTNQYFGFVSRANGVLTGTEVPLQAGKIPASALPHDLEAFCLLEVPVAGQDADRSDRFELLAVESGGYEPATSRRIYKLEFTHGGGQWKAEIIGQPVSYHAHVINTKSVPAGFEVEGMVCDGLGKNRYAVTLASRGRHEVAEKQDIGGYSGGLLNVVVDFGNARIEAAKPGYTEIEAPKCSVPAGAEVINGEWRDISDLYRTGNAVWAASVFEGEIANPAKPKSAKANYFCSTIYKLCAQSDCADLAQPPASLKTSGFEFPGRKIEGLQQGANAGTFAIASDEETTGAIDIIVPGASVKAREMPLKISPSKDL